MCKTNYFDEFTSIFYRRILDNDIYCKNTLQKLTVIQGNISPEVLRIGGDTMKKDIIKTLDTFGDYSFIMGLGHGVLKDTPVNNVLEFVDIVRKYKRI